MPPKRKASSRNGAQAKSKKEKLEVVEKEEEEKEDVTGSDEENSEEEEKPAKKGRGGGGKKKDAKPAAVLSKPVPLEEIDFKVEAKTESGEPWNLKIASWNVNGIRACMQKTGAAYIKLENPDIICVNETKCAVEKIPKNVLVDGYTNYWLAGDADGYSGVGIYTKIKPLNVTYGIDMEKHDKEGRVITAEYDKFYLVAAYVPNAGRKLVRLDYRQEWDVDFRAYLKELEKKKPVILCGDLNVAHEEIDIANAKGNKKNAGFTKEERDGFTELIKSGFIDTFRHLHPEEKSAYTFWTYMMNARAKNVGWRLDYFAISKSLLSNLCESIIRKDVMGSDHCPVVLLMAF